MSQQLEKASRQLLGPTGIERRDIEKTLDQMIVNDIDYADLYFEYSRPSHGCWKKASSGKAPTA